MTVEFGLVIRGVREERRLTQTQVGDACGVSRPAVAQWEAGTNMPEAERLPRLGDILGLDMEAAVRGERVLRRALGDMPARRPRPNPNARRTEDAPVDISRFVGPRDVPVYGIAAGGKKGDFTLNRDVIDYAPRPPGIAKRKDVFAIYVQGDSVAPAYEDGTRVWIDTQRRPSPRDYVLVELHSPEGEPGEGFLKRLVRITPSEVVLRQYQPAEEFSFDLSEVKHIYRVIPWEELLGV